MNTERLLLLIEQYQSNFSTLNNAKNDESYKWEAVAHFQKHFSFDAPDFASMFKEAMAKASNLINNHTVQPVNGILYLAKFEPDTVREMFQRLYAEDHGSIDERQIRIQDFVDQANSLLEKYARGKWKYAQDFRSVLAYLVFYKPAENYLYKASQCQPFFRYLDFTDEIGYGQYFKLSTYYRMADQVREFLKDHASLMQTHNSRWSERIIDCGDDLHLLVFDLIFCSQVYSFFSVSEYTRSLQSKSKSKAASGQSAAELEAHSQTMRQLIAERETIVETLNMLPDLQLMNTQVTHKMFGVGNVVEQRGTYLTVAFACKTSQFVLTQAFANGFLSCDDDTVVSTCAEIEKGMKEIARLDRAIRQEKTFLEKNGIQLDDA